MSESHRRFFRKNSDPVHVPEMPPGGSNPVPQLFEAWGEAGVRKLISSFYQKLGASSIGPMFGKDLEKGAEKSADFFIGAMGGPPLFHQKHGHPRLRMRHLPFRIDADARQVWLECFFVAIDEFVADHPTPEDKLEQFKNFLTDFSMWMVNSKD